MGLFQCPPNQQPIYISVSIGVMGKVYLTVDEDDLKRVIEKPEVKQMLDLENLLKTIK